MTSHLLFLDNLAIPSSWRFPLLTLGAVFALAGLDLIAAVFAKEWAQRGHTFLLAGGLISFAVLFVVYARILEVAELSVVTLGWFVVLQVMIVIVDKWIYGVSMPWPKWVAVIAIMVLQMYIILGPSNPPTATAQTTEASATSIESAN